MYSELYMFILVWSNVFTYWQFWTKYIFIYLNNNNKKDYKKKE